MNLPYRPNVGAVVFSKSGKVLVARRTDLAAAEPDKLQELIDEWFAYARETGVVVPEGP